MHECKCKYIHKLHPSVLQGIAISIVYLQFTYSSIKAGTTQDTELHLYRGWKNCPVTFSQSFSSLLRLLGKTSHFVDGHEKCTSILKGNSSSHESAVSLHWSVHCRGQSFANNHLKLTASFSLLNTAVPWLPPIRLLMDQRLFLSTVCHFQTFLACWLSAQLTFLLVCNVECSDGLGLCPLTSCFLFCFCFMVAGKQWGDALLPPTAEECVFVFFSTLLLISSALELKHWPCFHTKPLENSCACTALCPCEFMNFKCDTVYTIHQYWYPNILLEGC